MSNAEVARWRVEANLQRETERSPITDRRDSVQEWLEAVDRRHNEGRRWIDQADTRTYEQRALDNAEHWRELADDCDPERRGRFLSPVRTP